MEYEQLKEQHLRKSINPLGSPPDSAVSPLHTSEDAELIAEAKLLRQHKGRLEARMQILEDHNKQLESQLHRLRQLLEQVNTQRHTAAPSADFGVDEMAFKFANTFSVDVSIYFGALSVHTEVQQSLYIFTFTSRYICNSQNQN